MDLWDIIPDNAFFSTGLGWSVLGSLGWIGTAVGLVCRLQIWLSSAKTRKKKGPAGASPVAAPMPKSISL